MFLTTKEAEELRALAAGRDDLIAAIDRCVLHPPGAPGFPSDAAAISIPRTSTFEREICTAPIPPETMADLVARGKRPTRDL